MAVLRYLIFYVSVLIFYSHKQDVFRGQPCQSVKNNSIFLNVLIQNNTRSSDELILLSLNLYLSPPDVVISQDHFIPEERQLKVLNKYFLKPNKRSFMIFFLLGSGDIHPNPGPAIKATRTPKYPCDICSKGVIATSKAAVCTGSSCSNKVHLKCILSQDFNSVSYICRLCLIHELPFSKLQDTDSFQDVPTVNVSSSHSQHSSAEPSFYTDTSTGPSSTTLPSSASDDHFQCFVNKGLNFIHLNVRSILPKLSELKLIAMNTNAAVICLSETWLDSSVSDAEIHIDNYSVVRRDRDRHGGGVCCYIRNNIAFTTRLDLNVFNDEIIFIELLLPKTKPIIVGTLYRPPKQSNFIDHLENILTNLRSDCETYLLGDFNICFKQKTSVLFKSYSNILRMFDLHQVITEATRITQSTSSIIDHIITNSKDRLSQSGTISIGLSDHFMTYCTRKIPKQTLSKHFFPKLDV